MTRGVRYPSLEGRTVFVTGGASGIGAAFVEAFHDQGAKVGFIDVDHDASQALSARLSGVVGWIADVREPGVLETVIARAGEALGPITVLINNVADDTRAWADKTDAEAWRANLAVNLDPVFVASRAVQGAMAGAGGGSIINLGSINASLGQPDQTPYVTAKAAILGLTKSLARAWGWQKIRVNVISPGWVVTERQLALWLTPDVEARWMPHVALKERILPVDVANLALFLASDEARMITGQNFVIDAGRT